MRGGGLAAEEYLAGKRVLDRAVAAYWRNRNRVMRDRLVPLAARRAQLRRREVARG